jgi:AcrR family transcriptional regulator
MARRSDHTREQLHDMAISASETIVSKQGISALSTRKVAAEIGYSAGTLYQVFNNLDDLIFQLNNRTLARLQSHMLQQQRFDAMNRLKRYGHCYVEFAAQQPQLWHLLFEHKAAYPEQRPEKLLNNIDALFALVKHALIELKPSTDNHDIEVAANVLWSSIHGITVLMLQHKLAAGQLEPAMESVNCLIDNFISGWLSKGDDHA